MVTPVLTGNNRKCPCCDGIWRHRPDNDGGDERRPSLTGGAVRFTPGVTSRRRLLLVVGPKEEVIGRVRHERLGADVDR